MENGIELPRDLDFRLFRALVDDIDDRVRALTELVSLQETELTVMWFGLISMFGYILVKEHYGQRRIG